MWLSFFHERGAFIIINNFFGLFLPFCLKIIQLLPSVHLNGIWVSRVYSAMACQHTQRNICVTQMLFFFHPASFSSTQLPRMYGGKSNTNYLSCYETEEKALLHLPCWGKGWNHKTMISDDLIFLHINRRMVLSACQVLSNSLTFKEYQWMPTGQQKGKHGAKPILGSLP